MQLFIFHLDLGSNRCQTSEFQAFSWVSGGFFLTCPKPLRRSLGSRWCPPSLECALTRFQEPSELILLQSKVALLDNAVAVPSNAVFVTCHSSDLFRTIQIDSVCHMYPNVSKCFQHVDVAIPPNFGLNPSDYD